MKKMTQKMLVFCVLAMLLTTITSGCEAYAYSEDPYPYAAETFDEDIARFLNPNLDYLTLVNEDYPYDFNGYYAHALEESLIKAPDVYGEATPVEMATYIAFTRLQAALAEKGIIIGLYSAWRSESDQQWVYDNYSTPTNKVMPPGESEHHTGLVINFFVWYQFPGEDTPVWGTISAERQAEIPEFQIIYDTIADYGFIERYPADGESSTGVPCMPYEIRFVGDSFTAHEIMDYGYTLEEYLFPEEYLYSEEYPEDEEYPYPEEYPEDEEYPYPEEYQE